MKATFKYLIIASLVIASSHLIAQDWDKPEIDLIESVTVKKNYLKIEINKEFKKKYLYSDFFAEYDEDIDLEKLDYSIQIMPFIMNVVSIVWISGKKYYIDSMDEELYKSLKTIKKIFKRFYPNTRWKGKLIPRKLVTKGFVTAELKALEEREGDSTKQRIALLFSGGLDSTASSLYHQNKKQLLVTVWGHWDLPLNDTKLWNIRRKELRDFAKEHGHENTFIKSNYYSFLNRWVLDKISPEISSWRIFTVEGLGWAGLAAPVMMLKGYRELRHGSTITWEYNFPAAANPFIDDNILFAGYHLKHDLFDMNRLQKCEFIAEHCKAQACKPPHIRVCEEKIVGNCCECQKCIRTILELVVIGENPRAYGFDQNPEKIIKNSESFLAKHVTGSTTVWHFMHIQEKLKQRVKKGESVPAGLEWILDLNLKRKRTTDIRNQHPVDWSEFQEFLPSITIPNPLPRAFKID